MNAAEAHIENQRAALDKLQRKHNTLRGHMRVLQAELRDREQEVVRLREALMIWYDYDQALLDGRSEDAQVFYEAMWEKFRAREEAA